MIRPFFSAACIRTLPPLTSILPGALSSTATVPMCTAPPRRKISSAFFPRVSLSMPLTPSRVRLTWLPS